MCHTGSLLESILMRTNITHPLYLLEAHDPCGVHQHAIGTFMCSAGCQHAHGWCASNKVGLCTYSTLLGLVSPLRNEAMPDLWTTVYITIVFHDHPLPKGLRLWASASAPYSRFALWLTRSSSTDAVTQNRYTSSRNREGDKARPGGSLTGSTRTAMYRSHLFSN